MAILTFNEVRKGKVIVLEGEPYQVTFHAFLKKQQRRPVVKTSLRHLGTGSTKEHTFMQSDKIEEAEVERRPFQFLYREESKLSFMDQASYEQVELEEDLVGETAKFLLEGQEAIILMFEGKPVTVELPIKIERKIIEAPPGVKGDTSSNVTKEAVMEGGVKVRVPLFIDEGDVIRIDTRDGSYVERA